jgi:uncharacterized protein YqjF (DUF2071 family)
MHPSLQFTAHRPWPLPHGPWIMAQNWHDLLFAHWPVSADVMRKLLPKALEPDLYEGQAWIGIVSFTMSGVRLRRTPALPWFSSFPELNVRTYVTADGKLGVWFFSLDAGNRLAVEAARLSFHLPYFHARMNSQIGFDGITYSSRREDRRGRDERLEAMYSAHGAWFHAKPGTLEHFLTERYCLYAQKPDGELLRTDIHHAPWKLQQACATFTVNTMTQNLGIKIPELPPLLHFSKLQQMIVWSPTKTRV